MGALEGATITVLGKGVDFHAQDPYAASLLAGFPTGTTLLQGATAECTATVTGRGYTSAPTVTITGGGGTGKPRPRPTIGRKYHLLHGNEPGLGLQPQTDGDDHRWRRLGRNGDRQYFLRSGHFHQPGERRPVVTEIVPNPFPSNYSCNPSSIDGLGLTDSSQGGGAIFVHGWGSNLQIANNRIQNNAGTLSGGINVGQGEYPPAYIQGGTTNAAPGSCLNDPTLPAGTVLPYCQNVNVNIHNNFIALNSSTGDELFSATPAGAGGVSFCTGSDYYQFNYNWVCGNLSSAATAVVSVTSASATTVTSSTTRSSSTRASTRRFLPMAAESW